MSSSAIQAQHRAPAVVRGGLGLLSAVAPPLAARIGARLFSRPRRRPVRPPERDWLRRARRREIEGPGARLVTHSWGEGPRVLLHHGWSANGAQMTRFVPALLEAGLSVTALDARAHGGSQGRTNNLLQMTEDAVAVIRRLEPVAFVGHSMGAVVGVRAHRAGARVERMVLVAPPAEFEVYMELFSDAVGLSPRAHAAMMEQFRRERGARFEEFTAEWMTRDVLPPALVVFDEDDADAPASHARRWIDHWPSEVQSLRTRGLGHRAVLRDPRVVERVAAFLRSSARGRSGQELASG